MPPVGAPAGLDEPGAAGAPPWPDAAAILDANWTGRHTVPSRTLYPHQWSWDAGFIAIGLAHAAPDRAWLDLRSLFAAQWPDGRVPHIVFDPGVTERDYFPGPSLWTGGDRPVPNGVPAVPGSGIVQPPVHALGAWAVYRRAPGTAAAEQLRWLYPRLVAQQEYLGTARDVGGAGLSSIVHPWESGLDNSPSWDEALGAVPVVADLLRRYARRDNRVVASNHRPTDEDYSRYLSIALSYRDGGYRDADLRTRHSFLVECPGFNTLRGAAELALARIAGVVGADPAPHRARAAAITRLLVDRLFDPGTGMFHSLDVRTGRRSPARCVNGLLPLVLPDLPAARVSDLVAEIVSARFGVDERMPVPSYDRSAADFDPYRYWRGPVWFNINWLLFRGLRGHGRDALAATLRTALLGLARRSGYYEYFHPDTGEGIGSPAFGWTAALALDLRADGGVRGVAPELPEQPARSSR
ncbi:MGH1-like glycoside hydrolase domain-containing protein [Plantactinospora sp. CA-290183]|uniref:MGH1-like glycoside hydrolase domain-containing protein n=1 Tax=Plantactinospora sp. CA-290183 TaxID=3240006 RepID=UPI003D8C2812